MVKKLLELLRIRVDPFVLPKILISWAWRASTDGRCPPREFVAARAALSPSEEDSGKDNDDDDGAPECSPSESASVMVTSSSLVSAGW